MTVTITAYDPWRKETVTFEAPTRRDAERMVQHLVVRGLKNITIEEN